MTTKSSPSVGAIADTVVVAQLEGTTLWIWTRFLYAAGQTDGVVHGVASQLHFPDSANALGNAKAVNADLTDPAAFTVKS